MYDELLNFTALVTRRFIIDILCELGVGTKLGILPGEAVFVVSFSFIPSFLKFTFDCY